MKGEPGETEEGTAAAVPSPSAADCDVRAIVPIDEPDNPRIAERFAAVRRLHENDRVINAVGHKGKLAPHDVDCSVGPDRYAGALRIGDTHGDDHRLRESLPVV